MASANHVTMPTPNIQKYSQSQNVKKKQANLIGKADPESNLHPIKYAIPENETELEKNLRKRLEELQDWNQSFWSKHNKSYAEGKRSFEAELLKKKGPKDQTITADEMSVFYKEFLDRNWKNHINYLLKWYQQNFYTTFLHFRVILQNFLRKR
ncbi:hypothetical protein RUM43_010136 [Polyplax serrata]|uniref:APOPT family protein CG14806, mitochondrial n=1 Tax=Polyplax serrata TaxID=468196 RepID=A0AAN8S9X6_POLSC